jgi:hypothetical protein
MATKHTTKHGQRSSAPEAGPRINLLQLPDAPLNPNNAIGQNSALRGWLAFAIGGRSLPISSAIGRLLAWPCNLETLERVVLAMRVEFEGERHLRLMWGDSDSGVPAYAALGLPGAFTAWFVDFESAAALVGPLDDLRTETVRTQGGQAADAVCDRLADVLAALPCITPGCTLDLDGDQPGLIARRLAAEVLGMERSNISHAKCLAMMSPSIWRNFSLPFGVPEPSTPGPMSSDLTRSRSCKPGVARLPEGGR